MAGEPSGGGDGGGGKMIFILLFICFCCCCLSSLAAGGGWYSGYWPFGKEKETTAVGDGKSTLAPLGSTNISVTPPPSFSAPPPPAAPPPPSPPPPPPTATTRDALLAAGQAISAAEIEVGTDNINSAFSVLPTGYSPGSSIAATISFDVCIESSESIDRCFFAHDQTTLSPAFFITNSRAAIGGNKIMVTANAYDNVVSSTGLSVGPTTWYTITTVISGGNMTLYVNGVLDNTMTEGTWTWPGDTDPTWKWAVVGAAGSSASSTSIKLRNVYFWASPLTATQVKLLPASGATWQPGRLTPKYALGGRPSDKALAKFTKMENTNYTLTGKDIVWSAAEGAAATGVADGDLTWEGACALKCTKNTSCKSFMWDAGAATAALKCKGFSNRGDGQVSEQGKTLYYLKTEGAPRSGEDAGSNYSSKVGQSFYGYDIGTPYANKTVFECSVLCDSDQNCKSFFYNSSTKECGLKSSLGDGYAAADNFTIYYKGTTEPKSEDELLTQYTRIQGADLNYFNDNMIPLAQPASGDREATVSGQLVGLFIGQCAANCNANVSCLGFVYDEDHYNCYLKHTNGDGYYPSASRSYYYKTSASTTAPTSGASILAQYTPMANTKVGLVATSLTPGTTASLLTLPPQPTPPGMSRTVTLAWPTPSNEYDCAVACNKKSGCNAFLWDPTPPAGTAKCQLSGNSQGDSVANTDPAITSTWYYKTGQPAPVSTASIINQYTAVENTRVDVNRVQAGGIGSASFLSQFDVVNNWDCANKCNTTNNCKAFLWRPSMTGDLKCVLSSTTTGDSAAVTEPGSTWYYKTAPGAAPPRLPVQFLGIGTDHNLYYKTTVDSPWTLVPEANGMRSVSQRWVNGEKTLIGVSTAQKVFTKADLNPANLWTAAGTPSNYYWNSIVQIPSGVFGLETREGRTHFSASNTGINYYGGPMNQLRDRDGGTISMSFDGSYLVGITNNQIWKKKIVNVNLDIPDWSGDKGCIKQDLDGDYISVAEYGNDKYLMIKDDNLTYKLNGLAGQPVQTADTQPMIHVTWIRNPIDPPPVVPASGTSTYAVEPLAGPSISRGISYFKREPLWSRSDRGSVQPMNSDSDGFASW